MLQFSNYDLTNVFTPVNATQLDRLLTEVGYDPVKTNFLIDGFRNGFDLGYRESHFVSQTSPKPQVYNRQ